MVRVRCQIPLEVTSSRSGRAHQGYGLTGFGYEIDVLEYRSLRVVAKSDVFEFDSPFDFTDRLCVRLVFDLQRDVEKFEYSVAGSDSPLEQCIVHGQSANWLKESLNIQQERDHRSDFDRFTQNPAAPNN